jgi:anaerobic magnesium-protoporphyrin IX monomethyl ester cyclase
MTRIRIVFPPQFEPFQAYLSGSYLKGLLSRHGANTTLFDANIGFYDWLLSFATRTIPWQTRQHPNLEFLRRHVSNAVASLKRTPASLLEYRWAINVVDEYLNAVAPEGVKVGLSYLKVGNRYSDEHLMAYLDDENNFFARYFLEAADSILGPDSVNTYLFSLVVIDQLPAAVAFTREIKRRRPQARVFVGGPIVSRLQLQLKAVPWLAFTFDGIISGEAHRVLPELLGLPHQYTGHVTPDFSDLDLDRYWCSRRVLPYLVAHGCKWGKCTFCSHHLTYDGYRESPMIQVLDDLEMLTNRHQAEYISFSDEYLTPEQLTDLAQGIEERGLDIKWLTFVRLEREFRDARFVQRLYDAGCRMLMFGLESASQRVLNLMRKGTRVEHFRPILEACKAAGIAVRYDFMVGFPGETEEDAQWTFDFLRQNRDVIDTPFSSYSTAIFELRSGIPVLEMADRYRVLPRNPLRGALDDQYEFESVGGLSEVARIAWRERFIGYSKTELDIELICPQNKTDQLVLKDLFDQGLIDLPVCQIKPEDFTRLHVRLARGVEILSGSACWRVVNRANGGELDISNELLPSFRMLQEGETLSRCFACQRLWDADVFSRFVSFLSRNDYVVVAALENSVPLSRELPLPREEIGSMVKTAGSFA